MRFLQPDHPLRRLFSGTVQHVFYVDIGMCDPQIADYLTDLLSSLVHMDDIFPFHDACGRRLENLADWINDTQLDPSLPGETRQRTIHRHIGDFSLFWSGVFPEGLRQLTGPGPGDRLNLVLQQGKRSYSIASELTRSNEQPPASVLRRLSERFEYCVYGLNLCRNEWIALRERCKEA